MHELNLEVDNVNVDKLMEEEVQQKRFGTPPHFPQVFTVHELNLEVDNVNVNKLTEE